MTKPGSQIKGMKMLIFETNQQADPVLLAEAVRRSHPDIEVQPAHSLDEALRFAPACEVLIASPGAPRQSLIDAMPDLGWIHFVSAGTDALGAISFGKKPVVTSSRGSHGPQMSELAFMLMTAVLRNFPRMIENQKAHIWARWPQGLLLGKTVAIVGVGLIGEMLAARCKAFGMRTLGVSGGRETAPGFDEIVPRAALGEALGQADIAVVLVPYAPENHMLLGAEMLARLAPHAVLINLARGRIVDEAALREMLIDGKLRGAAMDVFEREPLPADDPLWDCPNLIITPHIGGFSDNYTDQMIPLLLENLAAWKAGKPETMRNLVSF